MFCFCSLFFTALHVMQTRYSDENSVCLSVCPSVTRVNCDKTVKRSVQIFIPHERSFSPLFWEEKWLVGGDPFYLKFWVNRPPLERTADFQSIIDSASAVTPSERSSINANRKSTTSCKNCSHECAADSKHCVTQPSMEQFWKYSLLTSGTNGIL